MQHTHFAKLVSSRGECVYRVNGKNPSGVRCWYYLLVDKAKLNKFNDRLESGQGELDLESYGKILAFGEGEGPTDAIKKELEETYKITLVA